MDTLILLRDLDRASAFVLYVPLFLLALSAYRRTKQKGFVVLGIAALLGIFNSPMPFQHGGIASSFRASALYANVFHIVAILRNLLLVIGIAIIGEGYCKLFTSSNANADNSGS